MTILNTFNSILSNNTPQTPEIPLFMKHIYEENVNQYQNDLRCQLSEIQRGRKILTSEYEIIKYITYYGNHHIVKLLNAFEHLDLKKLEGRSIDLYDWGCGQGLGTLTLLTHCFDKKLSLKLNNIYLIEPSKISVEKALIYLDDLCIKYSMQKSNIITINKEFDDLMLEDIKSKNTEITIHLFSNILDVCNFNLLRLGYLIRKSIKGINYFICVGPNYPGCVCHIDYFSYLLSRKFKTNIVSVDKTSMKALMYMYTTNQIQIGNIKRYEKIFVSDFGENA
jgi:hypothetical protein